MSSGTSPGQQSPDTAGAARAAHRPDWADGLRQLYDAVVDEPLPDTFKDLLDRLDDGGSHGDGHEANGSPGGHG